MDKLLTEQEAAEVLNFSASFLRQSRVNGTGPKYLKLGRSIRYQIDDLIAWVSDKKRQNTIEPKGRRYG